MLIKTISGDSIYPTTKVENVIGDEDSQDLQTQLDGINSLMNTVMEKLQTIKNIELEDCTLTIPEEMLVSPLTNTTIHIYNLFNDEIITYNVNELESNVIIIKQFSFVLFENKNASYYLSLPNPIVSGEGFTYTFYIKVTQNKLVENTLPYDIYFNKFNQTTFGFANPLFIMLDDLNCLVYTCLTPDTLITLSNGTYKRIDEITYDDKVLGYDPETLELVSQKIIFTDSMVKKSAEQYDVWTLSDGTIIKTVHEHSFYNVEQQRMLHMSEWNIGDHFIKEDGTRPWLVSHEVVEEHTLHFTLGAEHHNFFANGCLSGSHWTEKMNLR